MRREICADLLKGILAGMMIAMGCTVNLSVGGGAVGAALFSLGLFSVVALKLNLYTGLVGFLASEPTGKNFRAVGLALTGNLIGGILVGGMLTLTDLHAPLQQAARAAVDAKMTGGPVSTLILAFFCGMLMYLAVRAYRTCPDTVTKNALVLLCVMGFILSGYAHSVAAIGYIAIAGGAPMQVYGNVAAMVVGNAAGSLFFDGCLKYSDISLFRQEKTDGKAD